MWPDIFYIKVCDLDMPFVLSIGVCTMLIIVIPTALLHGILLSKKHQQLNTVMSS